MKMNLQQSEYNVFLEFVDACYRGEFDKIAYPLMQELLPHGGFSCGCADLGTGESVRWINHSFPEDFFSLPLSASGQHVCPNIKHWIREMHPVYFEQITLDDPCLRVPQRLHDQRPTVTLHRVAIHGVLAQTRYEANWFAFFGLLRPWTARDELMLKMLAPHLNVALTPRLLSATSVQQKRQQLSPRERDILQWLAHGRSASEVAKLLKISAHTVRTHIRSTLQKLNACNIPHAVTVGLETGLIHIKPSFGDFEQVAAPESLQFSAHHPELY